ncbi:hypothetical protein ALC62_12202 [Cyphomyrmex costatus]|uniref:Uncharacterized protein n=1 Tax=Cyphomyrmex costatus TaxID=456900 RepID=A0A195C877_9HYME|nr:hypothetical protein ALC62_12202 [Cyphomyrmex costatus]
MTLFMFAISQTGSRATSGRAFVITQQRLSKIKKYAYICCCVRPYHHQEKDPLQGHLLVDP